ncbi:MAG TPA: CHAP domain-containing protein, partial [Paenibacillaceae bacterium]|nr:CHAP domain-containing protein [Paenibacillaceae bacterium]
MKRVSIWIGLILSLFIVGGIFVVGVIMDWEKKKMEKVLPWNQQEIGSVIDEYKGVSVFENGLNYTQSHGKNFNPDGYYYGYKWQCVEYVKRFYYDAKGHSMPNLYGNAKDFFNNTLSQGAFNKERGLYQYLNGGNVKPEPDDLLVFQTGLYGHVAIITKVDN